MVRLVDRRAERARAAALDQPAPRSYLFTSAETGKAHSLAPLILRSFVRAGRIKTAESAPLFERVVGGMMHDLQAEGAPA